MNTEKNIITIEGEALKDLRDNINRAINSVIDKMNGTRENDAVITVKIKINLERDYEAGRDIIHPTFDHDVTTSVNIKDKVSGSAGGRDYELVGGKTGYAMKPVLEQTSMLG